MAAPLLNIGYDAQSLATIANFSHADIFLQQEIAAALEEIGPMVVTAEQANTWAVFAHPTGNLADSIGYALNGPMEVIITVGVPYGWRAEEGFHGADSLGRVYDQEGKPYAQPALDANADQIVMMLSNAVAEAFALAGGQ